MDSQEIEKWIRDVDKKLDNHLVHVAVDITNIKNDMDWIKRFFWLAMGTSFTAIVGLVISLILK